MLVVNTEGEQEREDLTVYRDDFWATTSNKQLNFLQHVKTILEINGRRHRHPRQRALRGRRRREGAAAAA